MRIAVVKPDYGVVGGFEVVMDRVVRELVNVGHDVYWRRVKVGDLGRNPFGLDVPPEVWQQAWEAFRYLSMLEAFLDIDASGSDLLISTQPPSFAARHPRQLALFSHHLRFYYDLSEVYVAAGYVDPAVHAVAQHAVRTVDAKYIQNPRYILAASEEVRDRLERFHPLGGRVGVYHAGSGAVEEQIGAEPGDVFEHVLCVSRHEFPKRTELFVHAMKYLMGREGVAVGAGGRLRYVHALDARLSAGLVDRDVQPEQLWCNRGDEVGVIPDHVESNVRFVGHVTAEHLAELYRTALCVVAPAYLEDYGLTAIEAMAFGKPLIVCRDGGGLTCFVEDGVNGFVVEPDGSAIAEAVQRLADDSALTRKMGDAARERAAEFSWARAMAEIDEGIERVMA